MINSKNFSIKQLTDFEEVMSLGKKLKNALEVEVIAKRYLENSSLIAVFQDSQIKYILEVQNKEVLQFKGMANGPPTSEDRSEVLDCLIDSGLVEK